MPLGRPAGTEAGRHPAGPTSPRCSPPARRRDADMREQPAGQAGEICVQGPSLTPGYLNNPEANADAFRGGWFHTGDLVGGCAGGGRRAGTPLPRPPRAVVRRPPSPCCCCCCCCCSQPSRRQPAALLCSATGREGPGGLPDGAGARQGDHLVGRREDQPHRGTGGDPRAVGGWG